MKPVSLPEERPSWDADRQRSELRGFSRLRAILWKRSLLLYQSYCLAGTSWYFPLIRALRKGPSPWELLSATRVKKKADIFGETPILTTVRLLETAEAIHGHLPRPFVDLGCGRGVTCLTAASLGYESLGVEQEESWVGSAQAVAHELSLPARFESGDLRLAKWPEGGTYLAVATAFPLELRKSIVERWRTLPPESTVIITGDWDLSEEGFERLWSGRFPVDWGTATFALWKPAKPLEAVP